MIHLKSIYNSYFIKYGLIFLVLFTTINIFFSLIKTINYATSIEENKESYRTIVISGENVDNIIEENKNYIENHEYDEVGNEYSITFYNMKDIEVFLKKYENSIYNYSQELFNETSYSKTKNIFLTIMIIILLLLAILIIVFSVGCINNMEKSIALYKLIGYKNKYIIFIIIVCLLLFYILIYVLSFIICILVCKLFIFKIVNNVIIINFRNFLEILFILLVIVTCVFFRIIFKIKTISPIKLIHTCD